MPAQAAKCPAFVNVESSQFSSKILAAVLTPMPSIEVSSSVAGRGHQSSIDGRQPRYDEACPAAVSLSGVLRCTTRWHHPPDHGLDWGHQACRTWQARLLDQSYNDGNVDDHARGPDWALTAPVHASRATAGRRNRSGHGRGDSTATAAATRPDPLVFFAQAIPVTGTRALAARIDELRSGRPAVSAVEHH